MRSEIYKKNYTEKKTQRNIYEKRYREKYLGEHSVGNMRRKIQRESYNERMMQKKLHRKKYRKAHIRKITQKSSKLQLKNYTEKIIWTEIHEEIIPREFQTGNYLERIIRRDLDRKIKKKRYTEGYTWKKAKKK